MKYPKPSEYPKLLPVKNATYRVCFAPKLSDDDCGFCAPQMELITLSKNQEPLEMLETLVHEVLHAIEAEYGIRIGHKKIDRIEKDLAQLILHFYRPVPQRREDSSK